MILLKEQMSTLRNARMFARALGNQPVLATKYQ